MTGHGPASTGSVPESAPRVSVLIPTRGRPALLVETLASITAQDYAGPLEIIVVHDREECDPTLARLSRPNREIVSTVNTRTGGLCGARNTGVLASRGAFVASCDDDDLWYPGKVRLQVERHTRDAFAHEHSRQVLAAAPVAADDHELLGVDRFARDGRNLQRLLQPLAGEQLHHDAVAVHDD